MTRINVGLAVSYMKLLLSSWKTCAILWHGISTNSNCAARIVDFYIVMRRTLSLIYTNLNVLTP